MRPKTMILFVIAVGCGLIASIGVSQYMEHASGSGGVAMETAKIFVAVTDINIGEPLDAQNVRLEEWPKDRVPEGSIAALEDLEERYPRTRLYAGEPILTAKLMDSNDGSKALTIPKGYRVVSVKVSVDSAVSGLVQPGDRVDLLVFLRKNSEIPETGTKTILREVNVFSVDGETERSVDSEGQVRNVRTVSLLVKPDQAESVMLASELGRLFLTLRRPDDELEDTTEGETVLSLLGESGEKTEDRENRTFDGNYVSQQAEEEQNRLSPVNTNLPEVEKEEIAPKWTMIIHTPNGHREFRWSDLQDLPQEVGDEPEVMRSQGSPGAGTATSNPASPLSSESTSEEFPVELAPTVSEDAESLLELE